MSVVLYTLGWVPDFPCGFVRDLRVRWTLEEILRPYKVATVPSDPKSDEHRAIQPFGQVPAIRDGDLTLFESGAIVLHLTEGTPLLPEGRRAEVTQWLIAALNTVEIASSGWIGMVLAGRWPEIFGPPSPPEAVEYARRTVIARLDALERLMADRDWIVGDFSAADIIMVDTLRVIEAEGELTDHPALTSYVARHRPGCLRQGHGRSHGPLAGSGWRASNGEVRLSRIPMARERR
ncbi:glutathione S-transferase family protein [uncultured Amaricoccus sp.]|uniref:glutathione S-transferase family protein n=1 Tax=uncultured Amaricoccus sp. TaxID=339341 RepID=UPI002620F612|nr:glutathione S-transferase family protein [uncultured Amaricoccus sp.]